MFGFVRKREVEELRKEVRRLKCKASGFETNDIATELALDGIKRQLGFSEWKIPMRNNGYHVHYKHPKVSVSEKVKLILNHLGLEAVPEDTNTETITTPAHLVPITAKANKRTAKKANGGDEESG